MKQKSHQLICICWFNPPARYMRGSVYILIWFIVLAPYWLRCGFIGIAWYFTNTIKKSSQYVHHWNDNNILKVAILDFSKTYLTIYRIAVTPLPVILAQWYLMSSVKWYFFLYLSLLFVQVSRLNIWRLLYLHYIIISKES